MYKVVGVHDYTEQGGFRSVAEAKSYMAPLAAFTGCAYALYRGSKLYHVYEYSVALKGLRVVG